MPFRYAQATFTGWTHIKAGRISLGRNNQDGIHATSYDGADLLVVTDGCGSYPHSEVGAKLLARLTHKLARSHLRRTSRGTGELIEKAPAPGDVFWERVRQGLLASIRSWAMMMTDDCESENQVIRDYFSAGITGALVTATYIQFFRIGDGIYVVKGEARAPRYPDNKPPYLSYALVPSDFDDRPELLEFSIETVPADDIQWFAVGGDGLGDYLRLSAGATRMPGNGSPLPPLEQIALESRFFDEPDALRRTLALANSESFKPDGSGRWERTAGILPDDTTLIVGRKVEGGE